MQKLLVKIYILWYYIQYHCIYCGLTKTILSKRPMTGMDVRLGPFSIEALKGWPAARKGWLLASSASWAKPWRRTVICEGGMVQAPGLAMP